MSKHILITSKTTEFTLKRAEENNVIFGKTYFSVSKEIVFYILMLMVLLSVVGLYFLNYLSIASVIIGAIVSLGLSIYKYLQPVFEMNFDFHFTEEEKREINEELWR
jgi:hypothetical protein